METLEEHIKSISPGMNLVNMVVKDTLVTSEEKLAEYKRAFPLFVRALQGSIDPMYPARAHVSVSKTKVLIHLNGCVLIFGIKTLAQLREVHEMVFERFQETLDGVVYDDELDLF